MYVLSRIHSVLIWMVAFQEYSLKKLQTDLDNSLWYDINLESSIILASRIKETNYGKVGLPKSISARSRAYAATPSRKKQRNG
jgi:hypothetical protein